MGGFRTGREAEEAFARFRDTVRTRDYVEPSRLTVEEFLTREWLPAARPHDPGRQAIVRALIHDNDDADRRTDHTPAVWCLVWPQGR